jgi:hypothetical protein
MAKFFKTAAIGLAAASMAAAAPASATIFEYTFNDGDVLTIDSDTGTGSWVGDDINATFTSDDFANFEGGANPSFMTTLTSIDGTRIINGQTVGLQSNPSHPEKLKTKHNGSKWNLWALWGDPVVGGDYVRKITGYSETEVPAPGMLGLFGLALAALGLGWRRRKANAAA